MNIIELFLRVFGIKLLMILSTKNKVDRLEYTIPNDRIKKLYKGSNNMMKYINTLLLIIIFLTMEGCNYKVVNANTFPDLKNKSSIDKMLATQTNQYIEKVVLAKFKVIFSQRTKENWYSSWDEFLRLFCKTYCALGNDTIDFLSKVKLNSDEEIIMKTIIEKNMIPVIRKRLKLITLLKNYVPKDNLEEAIIKRIRYYPALNSCTFWQDEFYKEHLAEPMLKKIKLGPLTNNSYIYIRCYGFNYSDDKIPISLNAFEASDELKGLVLGYDLRFNFYPRKKLPDKLQDSKNSQNKK